jgi:ribosomal protein S12 methylthiotransferase
MKVNLISLGCPKNLVDSEKILGSLGAAGVEICAMPEDSDIIIINTCAFIEPAIVETEKEIKKALAFASNKRVYVHGCGVNRYAKRLKDAFPEIAGFSTLEQTKKLLCSIQTDSRVSQTRLLTTQGYAYLKIADGCSNFCSYCTIPMIKGAYKSVDIDSLLRGIMYAHPNSLSDEMINEIRTNKKVCKYIDLPIQHISDRILKLMNRGMTKRQIRDQFRKLKQIKGISLRTTVIAGFPGETDIEFKELVNFIEDINIDWLGVFSFYRETGTQAAEFDQLPEHVIEERYQELLKLQQKIIQITNRKKIGETHKTLIHHKNTQYKGHTQYTCPEIDSNVLINTDDLMLGEFCNARFTSLNGCDINAEVVR